MSAITRLEGPREDDETVELEISAEFPGRIVRAEADGTLWLGRNYDILKSVDGARTWERVTSMPRDALRWIAQPSRLLCRLIRQEVRALIRTPSGTLVASNRQGVFVAKPGEKEMRRSHVEAGSEYPLMPPMRLSGGPNGEILWGEYGSPKVPRPVRLFASRDEGESFQPIRTIDDILHVHNIVWDAREGHYWVLTGDFDPEPGFGRLSADFERFDWLVRGEQRFRAVEIFDAGDRLVYATDTQLEPNAILSLDKRTGQVDRIRGLGGSCIYASRFGGIHAVSTSVEPSKVNESMYAELWLSRDLSTWKRAWQARKDRWNADYLQFGSVVLPSGGTDRELVVFSGQAIAGLDGKTAVARLPADAEL